MGVTCVEYSIHHLEIEDPLKKLDRFGDFCTSGRLVAPMPRLEVKQAGTVSFPVPGVHIDALIGAAERAPYGRGPETILDRSVRDCWQIDSSKIRVGGAGWSKTFDSILKSVAKGLGCPADRLEGRLYKLLVYETGGFFAAHRDTEKVKGMVGTLVISLPVTGSGGELIVRHNGHEATIDTHVSDPSELAYAAFYADCTHETLPVRNGHRVALVYNLALSGRRTDEFSRAPRFSDRVDAVAAPLAEWARSDTGPLKIVWVLDHDYSSDGLSFDCLKGLDDSVAQVLSKASRKAQCSLHAAILHIEEYGGPDYDNFDTYYPEDAEMGEVYDWKCWLDSWVAEDERSPSFGEIPLEQEELLPANALADAEPDRKYVEEASGNEGVNVAHTYLNAALVLWPSAKTVSVLAQRSVDAAMDFIEAQTVGDSCVRSGSPSPTELVSLLIAAWPDAPDYGLDSNSDVRSRFIRLLVALEDEPGMSRFLHEIVTARYIGDENDALVEAAVAFGSQIMDGFLPQLIEARAPVRVKSVADLTWALLDESPETNGRAWLETVREGARSLLRSLPNAFEPAESLSSWNQHLRETVDSDCIARILRIGWRFGMDPQTNAVARLLLEHPDTVTHDRVIPAALSLLKSDEDEHTRKPAFWRLWRESARVLLKRSATRPDDPSDWFVDARIDCSCELCLMLQAFCDDRRARTKRFKMVQFNRNHIEQRIQSLKLPMDRDTIKVGRPYTLVCTKNRADHRARLRRYHEDIDQMLKLIRSAGSEVRAADARHLHQQLKAATLNSV